jgi:KUP system potassium uptake protein
MNSAKRGNLSLGLAALGIVYGDLGTSPLYTMQTIVQAAGGRVTPADGLGSLSLLFWTLLITVSIKYCVFVMRADNNGEGGILALMALIGLNRAKGKLVLVSAGLFGAALIYGDGVITPAISVLSALEGVNVVTDALKPYVLPAAVVVLLALFGAQPLGTARIGRIFGPVMLLWFCTIALIGLIGILHHPHVLAAVNPWFGVRFLTRHGVASLAVLGGVFLSVTGAEALYADMGHLGRGPIRASWFGIVLPALLMSYAGQIGYVLDLPAGSPLAGNPFFLAAPSWAVVPLVVLATLATIIASQAIITGSFSMTRQAMQLGWFPGLHIRQTSASEYGQIYVPAVNWAMMASTVALALAFGSSDRLAGAYGTAVSTTMLLTTVLLYTAARQIWHWPVGLAALMAAVFLSVDISFFVANLMKIADGGWVPLVFGLAVYAIMTTWRAGATAMREKLEREVELPKAFVDRLQREQIPRVPGMGIFLTRATRPVPPIVVRHVRQFHSLPSRVISLSTSFKEVPRVAEEERLHFREEFENYWHFEVSFGFMEVPSLREVIEAARVKCADLDLDFDKMTFFAASDEVVRDPARSRLPWWRYKLFRFLYRNSVHVVDRFDLPAKDYVEVGRLMPL